MIPWVELDSAAIPGGGGMLRLMRRGGDVAIRLGAVELMTSRESGSERALALEACRRLGDPRQARVLIGGLGLGFTLRAALAALPPEAAIVVAELVPAVVAWARGPLAELFAGSLDDPRVTIVDGDVGVAIARGGWDAILLDVDNGPAGQVRDGNDALYAVPGLAAAHRALRPHGLLAVWSIDPAPAFTGRLRHAGFAVEELAVRAHGKRGGRHTIWIGRKV